MPRPTETQGAYGGLDNMLFSPLSPIRLRGESIFDPEEKQFPIFDCFKSGIDRARFFVATHKN